MPIYVGQKIGLVDNPIWASSIGTERLMIGQYRSYATRDDVRYTPSTERYISKTKQIAIDPKRAWRRLFRVVEIDPPLALPRERCSVV